ncbi:MAG: hypothetical protein ABIP53_11630 [Candidatus Limnocylindrales bacterium]
MAARFPDRGRASAVRDLLRRTLHLETRDVDIAPLGVLGQETCNETLLAGRFADEIAHRVAQVVTEAGGEIVANVDETWTRPRPATGRPTWSPVYRRDGLNA